MSGIPALWAGDKKKLPSPVKTKDFIFLLFFLFFPKKGVKFFENSLLIFHPTNQNVGCQKFLS